MRHQEALYHRSSYIYEAGYDFTVIRSFMEEEEGVLRPLFDRRMARALHFPFFIPSLWLLLS